MIESLMLLKKLLVNTITEHRFFFSNLDYEQPKIPVELIYSDKNQ